MTTFQDLELNASILKVLPELGLNNPTDIQKEAIPILVKKEGDFIGLAQTGTGKTAAFGLPLLHNVSPEEKYTQGLVLAPTRELGQQIADQLKDYCKYLKGVHTLAVYGGANIGTQINALKRTQHIIIATPGRLVDLIKRKAIKLNDVKTVVLDEADEMLNMGFKEDLDFILSHMPEEKTTWLFSATMASDIRKIVKKYMDKPVEVSVKSKSLVNEDISHEFMPLKASEKKDVLIRILDLNPDLKGVLFCRTRRDTQNLADDLKKVGYKVEALNGDMSQQQRDRVMKKFKGHELHMLIATDVAARGIDVNDLTHVIHFNLPDDMAYYTHRSGRTGRAGKKGTSLVLATRQEEGKLRRFERHLKIHFDKVDVPKSADVAGVKVENWANKVIQTQYNDKLKEAVEAADVILADLNREELIAKLVALELSHVDFSEPKSSGRKSERSGSSERGKSDRGRSGGRERSIQQIKVGLGSRDDLTKSELMRFLREETGANNRNFGEITLGRKSTVIEVEEKYIDAVIKSFSDMALEGRKVPVSVLDEPVSGGSRDGGFEPPRKKRGGKNFRSSKNKSGRGGGRRR